MSLNNKIDFAIIFKVKNANPNGDPLNGNRPRVDYANYGEVSDVCLKRKIRDRLQESGSAIFVQSDEKKTDGMTSLSRRAESVLGELLTRKDEAAKKACEIWFDVRSFGQVFAFKGKKASSKKKEGTTEDTKDANGVSIAIRGPVSIQSAFSRAPVDIVSTQITKSVNSEDTKDGGKSSDTMGMKHRIDNATYLTFGAMNPQLAERTGFSDGDAEAIKGILPKLFEGDASSARPEGSMKIEKVIWWKHNSKLGQYSSARVHETLKVNEDGTYQLNTLEGLTPEEIAGF